MIDKSCHSTVYITPPLILDLVREYFGGTIYLDPATEPGNPTGAQFFFTEADNGLIQDWDHPVFVNPPYGRVLQEWAEKIGLEAARGTNIVALLPGQRFETAYWQEHILRPELAAIVFIRRRVPFLRPDGTRAVGNPYGSMLYVFNGSQSRLSAFRTLGRICLPIWY